MNNCREPLTPSEKKIIKKTFLFRFLLGFVITIPIVVAMVLLFQNLFEFNHNDAFKIGEMVLNFIVLLALLRLLVFFALCFKQMMAYIQTKEKEIIVTKITFINKNWMRNEFRYIIHTEDGIIDSWESLIFNQQIKFSQLQKGDTIMMYKVLGSRDILFLGMGVSKKIPSSHPELDTYNNN